MNFIKILLIGFIIGLAGFTSVTPENNPVNKEVSDPGADSDSNSAVNSAKGLRFRFRRKSKKSKGKKNKKDKDEDDPVIHVVCSKYETPIRL